MRNTIHLLALILVAFIAFGALTACGKTASTEPVTTVETTETAATDVTAEETTEAVETTAAAEESLTEAQTENVTEAEVKTEAAEATTEAATEKIPQTKEEIVALYNDSVNQVKSKSKGVVSNYTFNTQTSDAVISNKMLQSIANKLISSNMGYDKKKANVTFTTPTDVLNNFPVRGETWSSKLTAADVSKATCTEKDGVYTVTLELVPDTTPNIKAGQGHAGKAFSIITKESIVEGAGSLGMSVIEEDSIKLTFKNCKITAKIDKETGKMLSGNYYQDWTLALTALNLDVAVSFGSEDDYTIKW